MRLFHWITLALLTLSPLAAATEDQGPPVGMIVHSDGKVTIERAGASRPALLADVLLAGDTLVAASGNAQFLFCPGPSKVSLAMGTRLKLTEQGLEVVQGAGPETTPMGRCTLPKVALGPDSQERIGAIRVRKAGVPELALYLGGPVASSRPPFAWEAYADASSYRLTLRDHHGNEVWQTDSSETSVTLPPSQPALETGVYEWQVEAIQHDRTIAQATTRFQVRPPGGTLTVPEASDPGEILLAAVEYENEGYYAEAAQLYARLATTGEPDDSLKQRLTWLYEQAGLTKAAEKTQGQ